MGVFVWMRQEWCLIFFYPILVGLQNKTVNSNGSDRTSVASVSVLALYPLSSLAIAVFFSGFLLMTVQIPFPHHVRILDVLYIQSQSSILIITGVLIFGLIFLSIHFLLEKTIKNGGIYEGLFLFLLLLISFINFALYSADTLGSFIEQFELTSVPFMVSGLLCNILLLIFGRIQIGASFTSQLNALHDGLTYRKFWIKTLFTFLFFRQLYGWLNQADQNFLVEVIYDVTNVICQVNKNTAEKQYLNLLEGILKNGEKRDTRNGITYSLFSKELVFDIEHSFPLLTTKRMFWRGIVEELLFFIRGETDSKNLEEKKINFKNNINEWWIK